MSWAEWEKTAIATDNQGGKITYYHDKSTIRKNGRIAKMWVMRDSSLPIYFSGGSFKSSKALMMFDCSEETFETFSFIWYADSMGKGRIMESQTRKESQWAFSPIIPDSAGEAEWQIACGGG